MNDRETGPQNDETATAPESPPETTDENGTPVDNPSG
jgi:hypothetical protein